MEAIVIENITLKYQLANYVKMYNELKESSSCSLLKIDISLCEEIDELKKQNKKLKEENEKLLEENGEFIGIIVRRSITEYDQTMLYLDALDEVAKLKDENYEQYFAGQSRHDAVYMRDEEDNLKFKKDNNIRLKQIAKTHIKK